MLSVFLRPQRQRDPLMRTAYSIETIALVRGAYLALASLKPVVRPSDIAAVIGCSHQLCATILTREVPEWTAAQHPPQQPEGTSRARAPSRQGKPSPAVSPRYSHALVIRVREAYTVLVSSAPVVLVADVAQRAGCSRQVCSTILTREVPEWTAARARAAEREGMRRAQATRQASTQEKVARVQAVVHDLYTTGTHPILPGDVARGAHVSARFVSKLLPTLLEPGEQDQTALRAESLRRARTAAAAQGWPHLASLHATMAARGWPNLRRGRQTQRRRQSVAVSSPEGAC
jgi:hypothetical protein